MTGPGGSHDNQAPDDMAHLPRRGPWAGPISIVADYASVGPCSLIYFGADLQEPLARVHSLVRIADAGSGAWSEFTRREIEEALQAVEASIAGIRTVMGHGAVQAAGVAA